MSGLSISNNLIANQVDLNLSEQQQKLAKESRTLSSGLRINSAADDPSGNAIASSLTTHAQGFDTASQNVSNAQNAAAIADGGLATVTDILLRIRSLSVEAATSIDSDSDRSNQQAEIDQLLLEINRVAQNANYNGEALLDGSHSGFQAAQSGSVLVTANSVLATNGGAPANAPSGMLVASTSSLNSTPFPMISVTLLGAVTGSSSPQTVKITNAQYVKPGMAFAQGNSYVQVLSVDPANGTMTATFTAPLAANAEIYSWFGTTTKTAISPGTQVVTLNGNAQPLWAGEVLQINATTFADNDVVVVQKVLSPTSFLATFKLAQPAGVAVFNVNYFTNNIGALNAGTYNIGFGGPADPPPDGTPVYLEEMSTGIGAASGTAEVVNVGTVVNSSANATTEFFKFANNTPNLFGGNFDIFSGLGAGNTPLAQTVDGTIKLQVVNTGTSIAVQETFYDTATQTATTSPFLLAPNESAMLYDGIITTLGDFTAADVGSTAYIKTLQASAAVTSTNTPAFQIQSAADEGDTILMGIPAVNTAMLRISNATVMGSLSPGTDPTLAAQDTIGQTDFAIQTVLGVRAKLGALVVRMSMDSTSDQQAAINLTASESSIADANIGAETTAFTEAQIDVEVATSILQQANSLPEQVLKLFR